MLEPVLIQGIQPGGQLTITTDVENYPGFADVIQGPWLMEQMQKQAEHVGTRIVTDHVTKVELQRRPFRLGGDLPKDAFAKLRYAVFGMHLWAGLNAGTIGYRSGSLMAGSDTFRLVVNGRQTHGSRPWGGVDPIVASAQVLNGMQTIVSRQTDITRYPAVVTVGAIKGGIRFNIIPDSVEMLGTIRTFDAGVREQTIERLRRMAENTAAASGATASVDILPGSNPVLINNPDLTRQVLPSLQKAAGAGKVVEMPFVTASEDYAHFAQQRPSVYFFVGSTPPGQDADQAPSNHSPLYFVDESALTVGVKAMVNVAVDYLNALHH
jgi:amidohydrolase